MPGAAWGCPPRGAALPLHRLFNDLPPSPPRAIFFSTRESRARRSGKGGNLVNYFFFSCFPGRAERVCAGRDSGDLPGAPRRGMPGDAVRRLAQPESRLRSEGRRGKGLGKGRGGGGEPGREKPAIKQLSLQGFVAVGAEPPRRAVRGRPAPNFAPIPGSPRQPPPSARPAPLNPLRAAAAPAERSERRERVPQTPELLQPPLPSLAPPGSASEPSPPRSPQSTGRWRPPSPQPRTLPGQSTPVPRPGENPGNPPRRVVLICPVLISRLGCERCQKEAGLN